MLLDVITKRYSVRSYQDKEVPEELLKEVLEAGRLAPSADNYQPWKFLVVRDKKKIREVAEKAKMQGFVKNAPVLIVGCIVRKGYPLSMGGSSELIDIGIALDHMTLQAAHIGLGTCWIVAFSEKELKEVLGIPENIRIPAVLTLGYPRDTHPGRKHRKPFEEVVSFETL